MSLPALAALHRRYDGRIPPAALAIAHLGSRAAAQLIEARSERAFFATMIRGQLRAIRKRRADGSAYPALYKDLALYRRHFRAWNRLAHELARAVKMTAASHRNGLAEQFRAAAEHEAAR